MITAKRIFTSPAIFLLGFLLCILGMIPSAVPVSAQEIGDENTQKDDVFMQIGVYFSWPGIVDNFSFVPWYGLGDIENPEDDIMPYPFSFLSIRYGNYEGIVGWADDNYGGINHNENIFKFALRYNYYRKNIYVYGGPVVWHFNKEFTFGNRYCTETELEGDSFNSPGYDGCKPGAWRVDEIRTDRPNGKTLWLGIFSGIGIKYKFLGLTWSHEIEGYATPCKYKDFICMGSDVKFLGIHL